MIELADAIQTYFDGEKAFGAGIVPLGVGLGVCAVWVFRRKEGGFKWGLGLVLAFALAACGSSQEDPAAWTAGGTLSVTAPAGVGLGLAAGLEDLAGVLAAGERSASVDGADNHLVVTVAVEADLPDEGYRLTVAGSELTLEASTEVGAMYGLYEVAADLGARWFHPEEASLHAGAPIELPVAEYDGAARTPAFALRGFHEHTQHPTVMSDYLMRPEEPGFREGVSNYLRWLARNRQNVLFFHYLKTVDQGAWVPWMQSITTEAAGYGVGVGAVIGFADEQQNAYKMIQDAEAAHAPQIAAALDGLLAGGLAYIGLQQGTTEFTKPADADVLGWFDATLAHLGDAWPEVEAFAWVHITCGLEQDDGSAPFYHLPLQADAALGAFVHTTMFYTLDHAAPVYECEDFGHQLDFLAAADGQRRQVFFPETAWWLGFDNNLPMALPLTGWSREWDLQEAIAPYDVAGHVTFTSGREWGYWQYDHYLTRATWERSTTWADYLGWIAPLYGAAGPAVVEVLGEWTELQRRHFYDEDPLMFFYVAGELPQDEVGAQAGLTARRPKIAFKTVLEYDDETFAAWEAGDLTRLRAMRDAYTGAFGDFPADPADASAQQLALLGEMRDVLSLYVQRIEQAVMLYEGVVAVRAGDRELAEARLAEARAVTEGAAQLIEAGETRYRYPLELLTELKPESKTAYPFGYLYETSTAFFWTRRDDQLDDLIGRVFDAEEQVWSATPDAVFVTDKEGTELVEPADPVAAGLLTGFLTPVLFGVSEPGPLGFTMLVAQDADGDQAPDGGTEIALTCVRHDSGCTGSASAWALRVYDATGAQLGELVVDMPTFEVALTWATAGDGVEAMTTADVAGTVATHSMVDLVLSVPAIGIDEESVRNLLAQMFGVASAADLPEDLPFAFRFPFAP